MYLRFVSFLNLNLTIMRIVDLKKITTIEKNGMKMDYILIQYKGNDKLYMPVEDISKLYKYY